MAEKIPVPKPESREAAFTPLEISIDLSEARIEHFPPSILEWISRLPERLTFSDPVTLIVGENGSGKTQFCRALAVKLGEERVGATPRSTPLLLEGNEPANVLKDAIKLAQPREGNILVADISGAEIAQAAEQWRANQAELHADNERLSGATAESALTEKEGVRRHLEDPANKVGSARQVFDMTLKNAVAMRLTGHVDRIFGDPTVPRGEGRTEKGDVVVLYDEPEYGMSPRRQFDLPTVVTSQFDKRHMVLVPTNNLVLFDSDLPRLDLSMPERGIHRPSEYQEGGMIRDPQK